MADQVAQTTEAIIEAVKNKRGGTVSTDDDLTSKELYDAYQKALDLLQKIEQGIATEGDKRALAAAKNQLEYYKAETNALVKLRGIERKSLDDRLKIRADIYRTFIDAEQRYNNKVRSTDTKLIFSALDGFSNPVGQDPLIAGFNALRPMDKITGMKKPAIAFDSPQYIPTFRAILDGMNDRNNADLFIYTPDGRVDVEASKAAIKNSDKGRNIGSPEFNRIFEFVDQYNQNLTRRIAYETQRRTEGTNAVNLYERAQQAADAGNDAEAERFLEEANESFVLKQLGFRSYNQLGDPDDLKARVADARMRQKSHQFAEEYVEKLRAQIMGGETSDSVRSGIAKGIADPVFRAWAADYGWDRLGRVSMNEDGTPDYSTYVAGGDDIAALLAWERQSKRAAGNYGLRGIDTGEVLRIEFTDGTAITGKRLRRHAADPKGVIRIVTPEGARQVYPGEVKRAIYLEKPAPDVTRIDRRAKRIYEREIGNYSRLETDAVLMADQTPLARVGDDVLEDAEGNLVAEDALKEAQDNRLRETGYHYIRTDGTRTSAYVEGDAISPELLAANPQLGVQLHHVVSPEGDVYEIDGEGNLIQLDDEQASGVLSLAAEEPGNRNYMFVEGEAGGLKMFSGDDFQSALTSGNIKFHTKVPTDSQEEIAALDAATAAHINPGVFGYKAVPDEGLFGSRSLQGSAFIDEYGSKGIDPEDLIPTDSELPEDLEDPLDPVEKAKNEAFAAAITLDEDHPGKIPGTLPRDPDAPGALPRVDSEESAREETDSLPPLKPGDTWEVDWRGSTRTAVLLPNGTIAIYNPTNYDSPQVAYEDMQRPPNQTQVTGGREAVTPYNSPIGTDIISASGRTYTPPPAEEPPKTKKKTKPSERRKMAGKKTAKSLRQPPGDLGVGSTEDVSVDRSIDLSKVFAPPEKPEKEETSGELPEPTGDMGIGQLFGPGSLFAKMMERRKKKKEERQAKKTKTKDANDDAETSSMLVLGKGGQNKFVNQSQLGTKISAKTLHKGFPPDETDKQGQKDE